MPGGGVPPPGAVLDGKYRVEGVVAEGGMGIIVLATQLQLDRRVAIKFLRSTAMMADGVIEQFEREAKLAAQIKSEHVVRVHDVGALPQLGPYMVMEYLEGQTLQSLLGHGPLPIDEAVDYVLQACDALAEIHALEIVHRDVKPENLFLAERPPHATIVKLIDFGISKGTPKRGSHGEWSTDTVGTPEYMSPEQLDTGVTDVRGDIWSLGVVLYELVTGRKPFEAADLPELCTNILTKQPLRPSQLRPDLPPAIEDAIMRCLMKDPARRTSSVLELAELIGPFGRTVEKSKRLQRGGLAASSVVARPRGDASRHAKTMLVARKRERSWAPAAIALFAALAVLGLGLGIYAVKFAPKKPTTAAVPVVTEPPVVSTTVESEPATPAPADSAATPSDPAPPAPGQAPRARPVRKSRPSDPRAGFGERR